MRHVVISKFGPPKVLRIERRDLLPPGPGQVAIDVAFAGVNFADLMMRLGLYPQAPKPPFVPGYEVSGTISAVGAGVKLAIGTRVMAGSRFGGQAERVNVPANQVVPLPDNITLQEGAAWPVIGLTAWTALHSHCRMRDGDKILIHGGAGGVGTAAIGLAKQMDVEIYATASSHKLDKLAALGVHALDRVHWQTTPEKFDIILDPVGGANLHASRRALAPFGKVVSFGLATAVSRRRNLLAVLPALRAMNVNVPKLMHRNQGVIGLDALTLWSQIEIRKPLEETIAQMSAGTLARPVIHKAFPVEDVAAAHEELHGRRNFGKVLLQF